MNTIHRIATCCILATGLASTVWCTNLVLIRDESWVTYRLVHPLHEVEATSKDVAYTVALDTATQQIMQVSAEVDVTTFDSGNSNRDSHAMEAIDAITYPAARFASTSITRRGDSLSVTGILTFHGVSKEVVARVRQLWSAGRLEVDGGFDVSLTAFNIERPSLLLIPVEDRLAFSFRAVFRVE